MVVIVHLIIYMHDIIYLRVWILRESVFHDNDISSHPFSTSTTPPPPLTTIMPPFKICIIVNQSIHFVKELVGLHIIHIIRQCSDVIYFILLCVLFYSFVFDFLPARGPKTDFHNMALLVLAGLN